MSETTRTMGDRAAEGLVRSLAFFLERVPGATEEAGASGVHLDDFTVPIASLTGVFALGPEPDPAEVATIADKAATIGRPWSIVTRAAPSREIVDVPDDATVRKVDGAHGEAFADALAAGFGMPSTLDDPAIDAFVLEVDGVAATTGENVVDGERVGPYNGAGRPEHPRRGTSAPWSVPGCGTRSRRARGSRSPRTRRCPGRSTNRSVSASWRTGPTSPSPATTDRQLLTRWWLSR